MHKMFYRNKLQVACKSKTIQFQYISLHPMIKYYPPTITYFTELMKYYKIILNFCLEAIDTIVTVEDKGCILIDTKIYREV